ncbi:MAG: TetR family transcriptional regulator [Acidobacteria bacterium]|nr:TetR family transcriptional regulator [Acidobacteriota bacterium]
MTPKIGMEPIRRSQVINAALRIIAEGGFEAVTLQKVAEGAGVSKGVVNYYFDSKDNLILESFRFFLEVYNKRIEAAFLPEMSALEMMDMMIDCIFLPETIKSRIKDKEIINEFEMELDSDELSRVFILFYTKGVIDQGFRSIFHEMYAGYREGILELIKYGTQTGEFKGSNPETIVFGLMGLIDGIILYHTLRLPGISNEDASKICKDSIRSLLNE